MGYNVTGSERNPIPQFIEPAKSPAEVEYDRVKTEIDHEYQKRLEDAKNEAAINDARARESLKKARIKAEMEDLAYRQKCYHDALISSGSDEDQAWDIFLKSIPQQPIYYGMDWGLGASLGSCSCG